MNKSDIISGRIKHKISAIPVYTGWKTLLEKKNYSD